MSKERQEKLRRKRDAAKAELGEHAKTVKAHVMMDRIPWWIKEGMAFIMTVGMALACIVMGATLIWAIAVYALPAVVILVLDDIGVAVSDMSTLSVMLVLGPPLLLMTILASVGSLLMIKKIYALFRRFRVWFRTKVGLTGQKGD